MGLKAWPDVKLLRVLESEQKLYLLGLEKPYST
jgi:hypothetical protein